MKPVRNPSPACAPRPVARGFTAIELLVVIGVLGVLFALALPSFQSLFERFRVRQTVEGLQSTMYYARSEAIKRGGNVVVAKQTCSGGNDIWNCGWVVCTSTNGNCGANSTLLQQFDTPVNIDVRRSTSSTSIQFDRWGLPDKPFGFSVMPTNRGINDPVARGVCMSSAGRVIISENPPCSP